MTAKPWQAPRRGGFLLLVLLAHGLLLVLLTLALQGAPRFVARPVAAPELKLLWLRQPEARAHEPAMAARPQREPRAPPLPRPANAVPPEMRQPTPPRSTLEPQAISIAPVPSDSSTNAPESGATATSPAPLDLRPPSQRASQPLPSAALTRDDPSVRERLSYSERMARGIGTDNTLHEEVLPNGVRRFKRGVDCLMVRPSRISELDGFNNSAAPSPRSVGRCWAGD